MSGNKQPAFDAEALKNEIKHDLLKQEILRDLDEDEIDLFELGAVLVRHWRLVVLFPFVVAVLVALYSLTMPNFFKAKATIFVHSKSGGMSSLLSSIPMAGLLGGLPGGGSSGEYLMAYLKSRTITDEIIQQFNLATDPLIIGDKPPEKVYYDDLLKIMDQVVAVSQDKSGLITLTAETRSASFSTELVRGYLGKLANFAKGPARQKRMFVEEQLNKVNEELAAAEMAFKAFQDEHKLVSIDEQSKAVIGKLVELESSKVQSEIQLKMQESLLQSSGNLPHLVQVESKKVAEEAKQAALAKAIGIAEGDLKALPALGLQYVRLKRHLAVREKVFSMLTEQFEMAKISEAEEGSMFEIMDQPRVPDRKSKPRRSIIVILAGLTAGMLGVFAAFFIEFWKKRQKEQAEKPAAATA